jgi:hypothetical protein
MKPVASPVGWINGTAVSVFIFLFILLPKRRRDKFLPKQSLYQLSYGPV